MRKPMHFKLFKNLFMKWRRAGSLLPCTNLPNVLLAISYIPDDISSLAINNIFIDLPSRICARSDCLDNRLYINYMVENV